MAYTGDFRLYGRKGSETRKFIKAAKSSSVLITGEKEFGGLTEDIYARYKFPPADYLKKTL
ncbi:hypothetical protein ADU37_CDS07770 [Thermococcus sp. 2319x1]|uniref:hypothetical protein n=1 Tax=Thermococcus sp. 2319x1 TaxID=1674923 RepID=UPI00073ABB07|nr:hypothetical protein [Thermococcus sp. 2319x1]ALV62476.1 hypothetical protein ADU37_CDS07770 [Thermococcus sp. 2319x1]